MAPVASPSIDHLAQTWRSILELGETLTEEEWKRPTGCPGWSVQDQVAHLVDYEANALGRPRPELPPDAAPLAGLDHVMNALGESNEVGVEARRSRAGREVLDELREVTDARLAQLQALTADDLAREITTPAGPGTLADMLTLRVMDTWSHEQDIRRALGRPGHETGPAATETVRYLARFLPVIVGKRAAAPEGATVVVDVSGADRVALRVTGGRAAIVDEDGDPTVTLTMPATTFAALAGGRSDAPDDVVIEGDEALGRAVVAQLGFLP
jgi:uncharacterized protein (TIGR03083 family)